MHRFRLLEHFLRVHSKLVYVCVCTMTSLFILQGGVPFYYNLVCENRLVESRPEFFWWWNTVPVVQSLDHSFAKNVFQKLHFGLLNYTVFYNLMKFIFEEVKVCFNCRPYFQQVKYFNVIAIKLANSFYLLIFFRQAFISDFGMFSNFFYKKLILFS